MAGWNMIVSAFLALVAFVAVQNVAGVPASDWLRFRETRPERVDPSPFFNSGTPLAGVTFAFIFLVPWATINQLSGVPWLPPPKEFPDAKVAVTY